MFFRHLCTEHGRKEGIFVPIGKTTLDDKYNFERPGLATKAKKQVGVEDITMKPLFIIHA